MKREQYQRDLGLASRTIRQSTNKYLVLKAIAPDEDGTDQILETQEEMVPAMAQSNLSRQQQCLETLLFRLPLLRTLATWLTPLQLLP